jgi:acyl dehydratase
MPKPVFIGDTLRAETEVIALKDSRSRPDAGIVTFEHRMFNQRGRARLRLRAHRADAGRG